jgi:hypothetical protein
MKAHHASYGFVAAFAGGLLSLGAFLLCVPVAAQEGPTSGGSSAAPAKPTPRTPDGHPDFSGFYNLGDIYHGDPKEEKPGQHVVERANDGSVFFDYGGANGAGGEAGGGARVRQIQNGKVNLLDRLCCRSPKFCPPLISTGCDVAVHRRNAIPPPA